jgi:hypothetical protein
MNLFGLDTISEDDRKNVARRNLNNLLTSYADEADIFTEIIQNSFDAVIKAKKENLYQGTTPRITIVIGRRNEGHHYFFVADNGIGMSPEIAQNLTVPGFSYGKKKGKTIGYKGVGASYFFAASQKISLLTIDKQRNKTEFTVRDSFEWIKNEDEREPSIDTKFDGPDYLNSLLPIDRGTAVYFQFHDGANPKNLNGIVIIGDGKETELKNWICFLASKTALGTVDSEEMAGIEIDLRLDLGESQLEQAWRIGDFSRENQIIGYPFPHKVFRTAKSIDEIEATPSEQRYRHNRKYHAVYKRWPAEEIIDSIPTLDSEEKSKLIEHLEWVDGYLCYSTDVLREVNNRMGGRSSLVRHGIRIAVDGIPQGRNLDLSLTSSQGLDRQSHIVLSFKGLELDTGRKISADEIVSSAIGKIGQRVVGVLKEYRWAMKKKDRPEVTSDLENWRSSIAARSQNSIIGELYLQLGLPPVFSVDPDNESEVIALFVSLISHNLLKGYRIQALSGYARYDSLIDIDSESDEVRSLEDIFSVRNEEINIHGLSRVLEFKFSFDDLLDDFDEKTKNPTEIDFVVCWTLPDLNVRRGRMEPTYGEWRDNRSIYAGSYVWVDENETSSIPVLVLKNYISEKLSLLEEKNGTPGIGYGTLNLIKRSDNEAQI